MDDIAIARAIHVVCVVIWIGGVAMVTTIVLPVVGRLDTAAKRVALFEAVERRFAWQARVATLLVGQVDFTWRIGSIFGPVLAAFSSGGCTPWCWSG
jgi:uncharacterized membrane protein